MNPQSTLHIGTTAEPVPSIDNSGTSPGTPSTQPVSPAASAPGAPVSDGPPTLAKKLTLEQALPMMRIGHRCARAGWLGRDVWCTVATGGRWTNHAGVGGDLGSFIVVNINGTYYPLAISAVDALAKDWVVLE